MKYILDIAALAAFVIFAAVGAKKGLIKACADFLGGVIAMVGAAMLSTPAAQWVFETFFRTSLEEKIATLVEGLTVGEAVQAVFSAFPDVIRRGLEAAQITQGSVVAQMQDSVDPLAKGITDALAPMLVSLISAMAMVVLFVLLLVVIRGIATLLTGLFDLPILRGLNAAAGAVFGALLSVPVIWVVLACIRIFTPLLSEDIGAYVQVMLSNSVVAGVFYEMNPAYMLLG